MISGAVIKTSSRPPLVYAMTGAEGICGGIATANKNALRAVIGCAESTGRRLAVISFSESPADRPAYLPQDAAFYGCRRSKIQFAARVNQYALQRSVLIFDHVTLARPVLPLAAAAWCQTVIVAHGSEADDRMKRLSRYSFRLATKILTNSELTLRRLKVHLPNVRATACLLGLSPDIPVRSEPSVSASPLQLESVDGTERTIGSQMLLLVARIDPGEMEKGHQAVVRAIAALRDSHPDLQAVFPGPGDGRRMIAELAEQLGVADRVFLPGFVTTECLQQLYQTCCAFVMPSQQEGFGLVYLEAMNFARPCIGCRNDGAEEVIVDQQTGFLLTDQHDVSELTFAIRQLVDDPVRARQIGQQGWQRLHSMFLASHHQNRFSDKLMEILST